MHNHETTNCVEVNILDNNSSDNTALIVEKHKNIENLNYYKNDSNIGADANIYNAYTNTKSKYVWVVGDDDLLDASIITNIINYIKNENPSAIIFNNTCAINDYEIFANYHDLAKKYCKHNIKILLQHTLISANIIKTELFDKDAAQINREDLYGHMHGILNNCIYGDNKIILLKDGIKVREKCAYFHDMGLYEKIPQKQYIYINWLATQLRFNKLFILKQIFGWNQLIKILNIYYFYRDEKYRHLCILGIKINMKRKRYR